MLKLFRGLGPHARIALFALVLAFLVTVLVWQVLQYALVRAVNEQLVGRATWNDLQVSPGTIRFLGVEVVDEQGRPVLSSPELRITYDTATLLRRLSFPSAVQEVSLERPRLRVRVDTDGRLNLASIYRPPPPRPVPPENVFRGLVQLRNGQVEYRDERVASFLASLVNVDGVLDLRLAESGKGHLYLDQGRTRYRVDAAWRRSFSDVTASVRVEDLDLADWGNYVYALFSAKVPPAARGHLSRGQAWGKLFVALRGPVERWRETAEVSGAIQLGGLEVVMEQGGYVIEKGRGRLTFAGHMLGIHDLQAMVGPDVVRFAGSVVGLTAPQVDLRVHASTPDIGATLRRFGLRTKAPVRGRGAVDLGLRGRMEAPRVNGRVRAPLFVFSDRVFRDVDAAFSYWQGVWRIDRAVARTASGRMAASGWLLPDSGNRMILRLQATDADLRQLASGVSGRASGDVSVIGTATSPLVLGSGSVHDVQVGGLDVSSAAGSFLYADRALFLRGVSARTDFGSLQAPVGFLDLSGSRRMFFVVDGQDVDWAFPGGTRIAGADVSAIVVGTPQRPVVGGPRRARGLGTAGFHLQDLDGWVAVNRDLVAVDRVTFRADGTPAVGSINISLDRADPGLFLMVRAPALDPLRLVARLPRPIRLGFTLGEGPFALDLGLQGEHAFFSGSLDAPGGLVTFLGAGPRNDYAGILAVSDLDASILGRVGFDSIHPQGRVDASALFSAERGGYRYFASGTSRTLRLAGLPFTELSADGWFGHGDMRFDHLDVTGPGGLLSVRGSGPRPWDLTWRASQLDIGLWSRTIRVGRNPARFRQSLVGFRLGDLEGYASAYGTARGPGKDVRVDGRVTVTEALLHGEPLQLGMVFSTDARELLVREGRLSLGGDPVQITGRVGLLAANPLDLHVTTPHLAMDRALAFTAWADPQAQGWLTADVRVQGPSSAPSASGDVSVFHAVIRGQPIDEAHASLQGQGSSVFIRQLMARIGVGTVTGSGRVSLRGPLDLTLQADDFPFDSVAALAQQGLQGRGDVTVHVGGTAAAPTLTGGFDVTDLLLVGDPSARVRGTVSWSAPQLRLEEVQLLQGDGLGRASVSGTVTMPRRALPATFGELLGEGGKRGASVDLLVKLDGARLPSLLRLSRSPLETRLAGFLDGTIGVRGLLPRPAITGDVRGREMRVGDVEVGDLSATFQADLAKDLLRHVELRTSGPGGQLDLLGDVDPDGPDRWTLTSKDFDLRVVEPFAPWTFAVDGKLDSSFSFSGTLEDPSLEGSFAVTQGLIANFDFKRFSGRVTGDAEGLRLQDFLLSIRAQEARLSGLIPVQWRDGRMIYTAPLRVDAQYAENDLDLLSLFIPGMEGTRGRLSVQMSVTGTYPDLRWIGDARIRDGLIRNQKLGVPVEDLQAHVIVRDRRLEIDRFTGRLGKGTFTVAGGADLAGVGLRNMSFTLKGTDLSLNLPPYLTSVVDADLHVVSGAPEPVVGGTVRARSASFSLPLEGLGGMGAPKAGTAEQGVTPSPGSEGDAVRSAPVSLSPIRFSIQVDLGQDAWLSFLGSTIRGDGQLDLVGRGTEIHPAGKVLLRQGRLQIPLYPTAFRLIEGAAYFSGDTGWLPELEVTAGAAVGDYDIYLDVKGMANDPQVLLTSNPPLSKLSIQRLLFTGNPNLPQGNNAMQQDVGGSGALNALVNLAQASFLSPVTSAITRIFALSEVTFEIPQTGGILLRVAKALDSKQHFFLTFSSLQGSNQQQLPRNLYGFEWRFARNQLLRISSDDQGGMHFFYQARWRF